MIGSVLGVSLVVEVSSVFCSVGFGSFFSLSVTVDVVSVVEVGLSTVSIPL